MPLHLFPIKSRSRTVHDRGLAREASQVTSPGGSSVEAFVGKKAETFDPNQLMLGFEIPPFEVHAREEIEEADSGEEQSALPLAKPRARQRVQRNLPIERIEIEIPEEERGCPHCRKPMQPFGTEITSEIEYQPARLFRERLPAQEVRLP